MSPGPYQAPWWLPGGHLQTLYGPLFGGSRVDWKRERWDAPDGDFIDVDRLPGPAGAPLVALFHGLEGGSSSFYAGALALELARRAWRFAVPHFRGCSGEPNRLPRAYHMGDADEIGWILRRLRAESSGAPLFAMGVSLGGNALLKWLGEDARAKDVLAAAAAVSAPVDVMAAGDALGHGFNLVYTRAFLATMKVVTAPLHGFRDTDDYWTRASAKPVLGRIAVPTLLLNARNDPFMPGAALPRRDEVSPSVRLEFPDQGGHAAFVSAPFPGNLDWMPQRVTAFFAEAMAGRETGSPAYANGIMPDPGVLSR